MSADTLKCTYQHTHICSATHTDTHRHTNTPSHTNTYPYSIMHAQIHTHTHTTPCRHTNVSLPEQYTFSQWHIHLRSRTNTKSHKSPPENNRRRLIIQWHNGWSGKVTSCLMYAAVFSGARRLSNIINNSDPGLHLFESAPLRKPGEEGTPKASDTQLH